MESSQDGCQRHLGVKLHVVFSSFPESEFGNGFGQLNRADGRHEFSAPFRAAHVSGIQESVGTIESHDEGAAKGNRARETQNT